MNDFKLLSNEDLGALASPFRRQILEELTENPDSAANIARRHEMSRQRVGYHMRDLEKAGYIEVAGERQQRGLKERLYRVRSFAYVHGTPTTIREVQDRYSWSTLVNSLAQGLWDLISVRKKADGEKKRVATLGIEVELTLANPKTRNAFTRELVSNIEDLVAKYDAHDVKNGRQFKLLIGAFPSNHSRRDENDTQH